MCVCATDLISLTAHLLDDDHNTALHTTQRPFWALLVGKKKKEKGTEGDSIPLTIYHLRERRLYYTLAGVGLAQARPNYGVMRNSTHGLLTSSPVCNHVHEHGSSGTGGLFCTKQRTSNHNWGRPQCEPERVDPLPTASERDQADVWRGWVRMLCRDGSVEGPRFRRPNHSRTQLGEKAPPCAQFLLYSQHSCLGEGYNAWF